MSSNSGTSAIGAVKNLRAIFEHNPPEDQAASPPSRSRSPAHSEASVHSRPVSKVRASFVAVARPGDTEEGQHWGLRKISDVTAMADIKREIDDGSLINGAAEPSNSDSQLNGVHSDPEPEPQQKAAEENTQAGLGSILKGSEFDTSPPTSRSKEDIGARESPKSPTSEMENLSASGMNGNPTPGKTSKSIGSRIKDAISSNRLGPPAAVKLRTTEGAKPINSPPTRRMPPPKPLGRSPTSPRTPRTPVSPNMEKPMTRGSPAKPMAVAESAKDGASSEEAKKSPKLPRETRRTSMNTQSPGAPRRGPSSPRTNELKKDAKPSSPEAKTKSTRVPASVAAPTAASAARSNNPTSLSRKPTVTKRDPQTAKSNTSIAPATKKAGRTSLPAQTHGADRAKSRISAARKAPDEGFLARMMRPTASSAQKAHEKVAPSSPPQSKRAAPGQAAKGRARISVTASDEDKENSHRGGQGLDVSLERADSGQVETNGHDKAESQPLNDITPAADPEKATTNPNTDALEASSA